MEMDKKSSLSTFLYKLLATLNSLHRSRPTTSPRTVSSMPISSNACSKTWDMRWNWLRDKATHQQLRMYWAKGTDNTADYFTKHHPPSHHLAMRPKYVLNAHQVTTLTRLLGARVCSDTDRYTAVTSSEHLKHQCISPIAKLASQSISPHNLLS